jgi:APA family basic amino acid/polyamine antiporter
VATGTYRELFTRVIYTEWIFFALLAVGLLLARRAPDWRPAWRIPGGAAVPLLFIAGSAGVVVNSVASQPRESAFGLALVLVGLPVFLLREVLHARRRLP